MKAIYNGIIVTETEELEGFAVLFEDTIVDIVNKSEIPESAELIDAKGGYILPGLIDIHIHGQLGLEIGFTDVDGIREISRHLTEFGVTAWYPTTTTLPEERLDWAFGEIKKAMETPEAEWQGAKVLGANSEGPYINHEKRGAQAPQYILKPNANFVIAHSDAVKIVTIAPEEDEGYAAIKEITEKTNTVVSLGHTGADFDTANCAFLSGAKLSTHTFNAMSPLNHRNPGVVGAALTNENVYCELICDTVHVNPALFGMMAKLKGEKLVLITDNIGPAGLPDGEYESGSLPVTLKSPYCTLHDGTIAGSVYHLNEAIRNFREHTTLPLPEIVKAASLNPATLMGEEKLRGSIKPGKRADIFIADKNFNVKNTFILGKMCYNSDY